MKTGTAKTHRGLPLSVQTGCFKDFTESARHYLLDSWVQHHSKFCRTGGWVGNSRMKDRLRSRCNVILSLPSTLVTMVTFLDDTAKQKETRIVGWIVYTRNGVLHYVYVRSAYRHGGAGQLLLAIALRGKSGVFGATHWAKDLPQEGLFRVPTGPYIEYVGFDPLKPLSAVAAEMEVRARAC